MITPIEDKKCEVCGFIPCECYRATPQKDIEGWENRFDEQWREIMWLETDPDGTPDMWLIRDENDQVLNGMDFSEEKAALKLFIQSLLTQERERVERVIDERLAHWKKCHAEAMPENTLIGYHADSCIRALTDLKAKLKNE